MASLRKFGCLALAFVLMLGLLPGCSGNSSGRVLKYDLDGPVTNLDPQFATEQSARTVIYNLFEGLMRQCPDGSLDYGVATGHTLSADGLTYTFMLDPAATWSDGEPLAADDFVFALRRLFSSVAPSPYATEYRSIAGAKSILNGEAPATSLGVTAADKQTLIIELDTPSPLLLENLSNSAAMPCRKDFFESTKGRYGLERKFVTGNGPFTLEAWDNSKSLQLRPNGHYVTGTPVTSGGANLYVGRENPVNQFVLGNSDTAEVDSQIMAGLDGKNISYTPLEKTVWCLVFNPNSKGYSSTLVRQGLAQCLNRQELAKLLDPELTLTDLFLPPSVVLSGVSYRQLASVESPLPYDVGKGMHLYSLGMENLVIERLPNTTVYVPNTGSHASAMSVVQQSWQKNLGVYSNVESLPPAQLIDRYQSGNYQVLLLPFSPQSPGPQGLLKQYVSNSPDNRADYKNPLYDLALDRAADAGSLEDIVEYYRQCELMLLSDAIVIPLYRETTFQAYSDDMTGIEAFPFGGKIYFK